MSKTGSGAVWSAVLILPALAGSVALANYWGTGDDPRPDVILTFIILNAILASVFAERKPADWLLVFLAYLITSVVAAVVTGSLILIIGLKAGWLEWGKIGG